MYTDPSGHSLLGALILIASAIYAGYTIYQGTGEMAAANDYSAVMEQEQEAVYTYRDNCMGQCHYSHSSFPEPGVPTGPKPDTPLTDKYSTGMADAYLGAMGVIGGASTILGIASVPSSTEISPRKRSGPFNE